MATTLAGVADRVPAVHGVHRVGHRPHDPERRHRSDQSRSGHQRCADRPAPGHSLWAVLRHDGRMAGTGCRPDQPAQPDRLRHCAVEPCHRWRRPCPELRLVLRLAHAGRTGRGLTGSCRDLADRRPVRAGQARPADRHLSDGAGRRQRRRAVHRRWPAQCSSGRELHGRAALGGTHPLAPVVRHLRAWRFAGRDGIPVHPRTGAWSDGTNTRLH